MADRKRILVADDDPDLLDLIKMNLTLQGYQVFPAANGKDALQIASTESLDMALLDVMMPYIDGYHVASEITSKLGNNAPKILIMTSRDTDKEKGVALLAGAMTVIQKPFTLQALNQLVAEVLAGD
ncbi:MAG: response regulator [Elusimicrobia bacterium]|nr:response regulator [Elusimicrobiota bacterium]